MLDAQLPWQNLKKAKFSDIEPTIEWYLPGSFRIQECCRKFRDLSASTERIELSLKHTSVCECDSNHSSNPAEPPHSRISLVQGPTPIIRRRSSLDPRLSLPVDILRGIITREASSSRKEKRAIPSNHSTPMHSPLTSSRNSRASSAKGSPLGSPTGPLRVPVASPSGLDLPASFTNGLRMTVNGFSSI